LKEQLQRANKDREGPGSSWAFVIDLLAYVAAGVDYLDI
jgi:hypothetical protein